MDGQTDGRAGGWVVGWVDRRTDGQSERERQADRQTADTPTYTLRKQELISKTNKVSYEEHQS